MTTLLSTIRNLVGVDAQRHVVTTLPQKLQRLDAELEILTEHLERNAPTQNDKKALEKFRAKVNKYRDRYVELERSGYWEESRAHEAQEWKKTVDQALSNCLIELEWADYLVDFEGGNRGLEIRRGLSTQKRVEIEEQKKAQEEAH